MLDRCSLQVHICELFNICCIGCLFCTHLFTTEKNRKRKTIIRKRIEHAIVILKRRKIVIVVCAKSEFIRQCRCRALRLQRSAFQPTRRGGFKWLFDVSDREGNVQQYGIIQEERGATGGWGK